MNSYDIYTSFCGYHEDILRYLSWMIYFEKLIYLLKLLYLRNIKISECEHRNANFTVFLHYTMWNIRNIRHLKTVTVSVTDHNVCLVWCRNNFISARRSLEEKRATQASDRINYLAISLSCRLIVVTQTMILRQKWTR